MTRRNKTRMAKNRRLDQYYKTILVVIEMPQNYGNS